MSTKDCKRSIVNRAREAGEVHHLSVAVASKEGEAWDLFWPSVDRAQAICLSQQFRRGPYFLWWERERQRAWKRDIPALDHHPILHSRCLFISKKIVNWIELPHFSIHRSILIISSIHNQPGVANSNRHLRYVALWVSDHASYKQAVVRIIS